MHLRRRSMLPLFSVPVLAIGLAACGGNNSSSGSTGSAATSTGGVANTVSTKSISGTGTVLVDAKGNALYTNNRDSASKVVCTGSCTSIWVPLAAPSSGQPTSTDSSVQAKLGVVKGANSSQVTYGGKPLYTFVQDSPGQVTGNGAMDSFNGTSFTWTAAMAPGAAASPSATSTGSSGGGSGY